MIGPIEALARVDEEWVRKTSTDALTALLVCAAKSRPMTNIKSLRACSPSHD